MDGKIRAIVVDDEELARAVVREYLLGHADVEVLAECANGFDAVRAIQELKPDLVFLDVQMPKLDGFEVLELAAGDFAVVFVTAYDSYALRAFEVHAVDYLLKPFSAERLAEALERVRSRTSRSGTPPARALIEAAHPAGRPLERVVVADGAKIHVIPVDAIDYIEAQDDYASIMTGGKSYLKQQTLASFEGMLDRERFVRIHRSYIVNLDRLVRLDPQARDSRVAVLSSGAALPVSRAGYGRLKSLLGS